MNVVSIYAPRPEHPLYQDYTPFLDILRESCKRYGHRHIVITDDLQVGQYPEGTLDYSGGDAFFVEALPRPLMKAIIFGQLAYLNSSLAKEDTLFLGADCVLARDPAEVFKREFDIAFTVGPFADCVLNTGAIFIRSGFDAAYIWVRAFANMGEEWGDDQKALAAVVKPTSTPSVVCSYGNGPVIRFLPVDPYNLAPEYPDDDCSRGYVLHFRGERKQWMKDYSAKWLGIGERIEWNVVSNSPKDKIFENVAINSRRQIPWAKEMPAHDGHAVIVGGGPSAADCLNDLRRREAQGQDLFALNGAAQWLAQYGLIPKYQVLLDSRPQNRRFVRPICAEAFLVASQCDPAIFDILSREDVTLFHHAEEGIEGQFEGHSILIGGGITVGLTALALAYALGYRQMHLYGYDSSDRDGESHAYAQAEAGAENERREVWCGRKKFVCSPAMYAQAQAFPEFAKLLADHGVVITVHGSGLLPEVARQTFGMAQVAA
jgi:uncharacterized Rossmann fold enzyme